MAPTPARETLWLVDGTSQLFRAHFAIRGLTNAEGMPTNAVFGFTTMLRKLLQEQPVTHLGIAFDTEGRVFRHDTYAGYKSSRPPTPPELRAQVPYAKAVSEVLGATVLERRGIEADDLLATYARLARERGMEVVIVASDKDLLQLVRDGVRVLNPTKNLFFDAEEVRRSFGVPPERVLDVQGLMGDSVDDIPGVPGVGGKTAVEIVSRYGDLESVLARAVRFAAFVEARDRALAAIDAPADGALPVADALGALSARLAELVGGEPESELRERLVVLASQLDAVDRERVAKETGAAATRRLRGLKRELKAIDRGAAVKTWLAIRDHAEQARLSKVLATLDSRVAVDRDPERLARAPIDFERGSELFGRLGFRLPLAEFGAASGRGADAAEATAGIEVRDAPAGRYEAILDAARLDRAVEECRRAGRCAVTAEIDGPDPLRAGLIGVALAHAEGHAIYVPLRHAYLGAPSQLPLEVLRERLGPLLSDPSVAKVGHDVKPTDHALRRHGMPVAGWALDAMVAGFLLDPDGGGRGIASLAEEHLGRAPAAGEPGPAADSFVALDVERAGEQAGERADWTRRLAATLETRLAAEGLAALYRDVDGPLLPVLARMEARGIRVDAAALGRMSQEMERSIAALRDEVHRLAGAEFNVDSPKQLREILFERLGLRAGRKTAKSRVASTDAAVLGELADAHPIAARLLEYRELTKLKGTYVDALPKLVHPETGRVHTRYNPAGAATGRLSSSDPNLQNIPARTDAGRVIRSAFVPQDGWVFLAADYSQVELRVLAHLAQDPELIAAFRAGDDIHRYTAARVFGVAPPLVTDGMRGRAKAVNFGILYGMSATRLAREQGMRRADADRFIESYFERFAAVRSYIEGVREAAQRDGVVRTLFGRLRRFPQLHGRGNRAVREAALRAAVNTTIQGTAADLMKMAMLRVERTLEERGSAARMLLQVHDELLLEVPAAEAQEVGTLVREAMEGVHRLDVPLVVDQGIGSNWREVT